MGRQIAFLIILTAFFVLTSPVLAEDRLVPSVYPTIQAGIDAAVGGDTVIIAQGTYTGSGNRDLDFGGKAITVQSTDPNDPDVVADTVINCQGSYSNKHRGFNFRNSEGSNSILAGLTITNGYGPMEDIGTSSFSVGGAVFCSGSSPTITKCVITGNIGEFGGGAIYCYGICSPKISYCKILNNSAKIGGAIYYRNNGSSVIEHCIIAKNSSSKYYGGAIVCSHNSLAISHCTFTDNISSSFSGISGILHFYQSNSTMDHCILWDVSNYNGPEIHVATGSSPKTSEFF